MKVIESKTPIIILSHHNCELFCCHLDGYQSNIDALLRRLEKIEAEFLSKPTHTKFRVWYNMDANKLDKPTMKLIAESIYRFHEHIYKISFIGLCGITKWKFNRILEQVLKEKRILKKYYMDAELAKGWLV